MLWVVDPDLSYLNGQECELGNSRQRLPRRRLLNGGYDKSRMLFQVFLSSEKDGKMDRFIDYEDVEQDLDDLSLYPEDWKMLPLYNLWLVAEKEAGVALFYMQFLNPPETGWGIQADQIHKMCRELVELRLDCLCSPVEWSETRLKLMKWLFKFQDEVENQC